MEKILGRRPQNTTAVIAKATLLAALVANAMGCGGSPAAANRLAIVAEPAMLSQTLAGNIIRTRHVDLYTTVDDPSRVRALIDLLDGMYARMRHELLQPGESPRRIKAYYVHFLRDWRRLIVEQTGDAAPIYLQIVRGGFSLDERLMLRYLGEQDTLAVAAHEVVHAFIGAHFRRRPPAFIEEGLATCYETAVVSGGVLRLDKARNPNRLARLIAARDSGRLLPLARLLDTHAGDFVGSMAGTDLFYAQAWAFIQLLRSEPGLSRQLDRMLRDAALGQLPAQLSAALVEHYFETDLSSLDARFRLYMSELQPTAE